MAAVVTAKCIGCGGTRDISAGEVSDGDHPFCDRCFMPMVAIGAAVTAGPASTVSLSVHGAYHPRDRGNAAGADHLVVTADFVSGRLQRKAGDALCKPARKFWGLEAQPERSPTCKRCLDIANRHGLAVPGREA